jgi:integrase
MQVVNNTLEDFLSSVFVLSHSRSTVSTYRLSIVNREKSGFRDFLNQKYKIDEYFLFEKIKNEEMDVYKILNEFVLFLDTSQYEPRSIKTRLAATKGYLRHLGIKIYTEDCKHNIRMPKIVTHREEPLTKEMLVRLLRNVSPKLQTAILVAVSTGIRIGELVQLEIRDIDFNSLPTKVRIRAETTKTREERETFLTAEATNSLKDYLRRFYGWIEGEKNESLRTQIIFGRTSLSKWKVRSDDELKRGAHLASENTLQRMLSNRIEKIPDLSRLNENGRKVIHFHAFRKYFRTTVGNACGRDFAEAIIGHGFYMDTYYNLSEEERRSLYVKAEPYLTISDFAKIEKTLKGISEKQEELEAKVARLEKNAIQVPDFLDR